MELIESMQERKLNVTHTNDGMKKQTNTCKAPTTNGQIKDTAGTGGEIVKMRKEQPKSNTMRDKEEDRYSQSQEIAL